MGLREEILERIEANGSYIVPCGFLDEPRSAPLRDALRELRAEGRIVLVRADGMEHWQEAKERT